MRSILSLLLFVSLAVTACGQSTFDEKLKSLYNNTVPLITADSLAKELTSKNLIILDTRAPKEFKVSHLPNALLIDYDNFTPNDVKNLNRNTPVVVYCSVGYRSERIGEKLQKLGFKDVKNLYGGIFAWKNENYHVINRYGLPTDSVHTYNENWSQWLLNGIKVYE
jgi:rhodanese-related sulfurtransferase